MSNDNENRRPAQAVSEAAGEIGAGIDAGAANIPEGERDARVATETAADAAQVVAGVARAVDGGAQLGQAVAAGDAGRVAGSAGNLVSGLAGAAGGVADGIADLLPEAASGGRQALQTAATAARAVSGVARNVERVVDTVQQVVRAMEGRRVVFQTAADLGEGRLVAERAHGSQRLSSLYEFTIRVEWDEDGGLDREALDAILSSPARLGLTQGTDGSVYGLVRRIQMHAVHAPRPTHYDLTLVPKLWRLGLTKRSRIYRDMSHLDVVKAVLQQHGFREGEHFADHTEESYPPRESVVQYRETDLAFVQRLLAHNGIHFHFMQDPGGEVLVLGDRNAAFEPVQHEDQLVYHPHELAPDDGAPRVWDMRRVDQAGTRRVIEREYNWRTPRNPLRAERTVETESGYGFCDLWGEHFQDDAQGRRLAQIRAEQERVHREVYVGKTSFRGVQPGSTFDLTRHPHDSCNQRYLVVTNDEHMDDGHTYVNEFTAIPFSVTYRPETLPWPRVDGILNAIVDGERRATATPVDDDGRYRVVLPLDETGTSGGRASRWVRRAQPSAGAGYGQHFPLHIGTEVVVACVNGDPDRPVILGAVPNAATQSPVVAGNATQSRIRTGSGVVIELDDDC
jgi:type VI secretion system VgrG family protein